MKYATWFYAISIQTKGTCGRTFTEDQLIRQCLISRISRAVLQTGRVEMTQPITRSRFYGVKYDLSSVILLRTEQTHHKIFCSKASVDTKLPIR